MQENRKPVGITFQKGGFILHCTEISSERGFSYSQQVFTYSSAGLELMNPLMVLYVDSVLGVPM